MSEFPIAFGMACLCGIGARDQLLLAQMTAAGGRHRAWLATAVATAGVTAALATWAGMEVGTLDTAHGGRLASGLVLVLAGARLLFPVPTRQLGEPTNSLGAAAIVLFAVQITDAVRLSIMALAVFGSGAHTATGGALGNAVALAIGWRHGGRVLRMLPLQVRARRIFGAILIAVAGVLTVPGMIDRF